MDLQELKTRLPLVSVVVGGFVFALPIMMDHSPLEVAQAFKQWAPLFYVSGGLIVLYALMVLAYRKGRASVKLVPAAPPATSRPAAPIGELIYAANEIASIVTERGNMRLQQYEAVLPLLERRHRAWHDELAHADRNLFLTAARLTRDARVVNGPGWRAGPYAAGDLKDDEREAAELLIEGRRAALVARLKELEGPSNEGG